MSTNAAMFLIGVSVIGFYAFGFAVIVLAFTCLRKSVYGQFRDLRERLEDRGVIECGNLEKPRADEVAEHGGKNGAA